MGHYNSTQCMYGLQFMYVCMYRLQGHRRSKMIFPLEEVG